MRRTIRTCSAAVAMMATACACMAAEKKAFRSGEVWPDTQGRHINAHGGGILFREGTYYWFGEKRGREQESLGVNAYSSKDLYEWKHESTALSPVENDPDHDLARGCVMERPKVLYNETSKQYVMWFHLELKDKGYSAARAAVAVSDTPVGPYKFLRSFRPNDNMSRDMTLFKDKDGSAYHIYASRDNQDMRICQLSDDYLSPTDKDVLIASDTREAPAVFEYRGTYYLITSGCTSWQPNAANYYTAEKLLGPWTKRDNPMRGPNADKCFGGQSTFVLALPEHPGAFIFMADIWKGSKNLSDSRYIWLPIQFENGRLVIEWRAEWDLSWFEKGTR